MNLSSFADITYNDIKSKNLYDIKPYQLSIGITPKCNSRCNYCVNWKDSHSQIPTLKQLIDIVLSAKELGVKQVLISGGEPLMHPHWKEIICEIKSLGLDILIITNGLLLDEESLEFINDVGCKKVGISLDTISPNIYKRIRGVSILNIVDVISKLKEKNYVNIKNSLSVCCTVHRNNIDYLADLLYFCMEQQISIQFQPIQLDSTAPSTAKEYWPTLEQLGKIKNFFENVIDLKASGALISNSNDYISKIYDYFKLGYFIPYRCYAPFAQITIDQSLNLRPCWAMPPVGNISNGDDLYRLWHSDKMNDARNRAQNRLCPGCFYSCHLSKKYNKL